jgi:AcrR family transcriptional regulator
MGHAGGGVMWATIMALIAILEEEAPRRFSQIGVGRFLLRWPEDSHRCRTQSPAQSRSPGRAADLRRVTPRSKKLRSGCSGCSGSGFEATTVQAIADECRIGLRTPFRYFESRKTSPWGQLDGCLVHLRDTLEAMPRDLPIHQAAQRAVLNFNQLDEAAVSQHRQRMALILCPPALQAHSAPRYANWRQVIAECVVRRLGISPDAMLPRMVGQASLALALSVRALVQARGCILA